MKKELKIQINIDSSEEAVLWIKQNTVQWSFFKNAYEYDYLQFRIHGGKYMFFLRPDVSSFEFSVLEQIGQCEIAGEIHLLKHFKYWLGFVLIFLNIWIIPVVWNYIGVFVPIISVGISILFIWYLKEKYYDKRLERKILALFEPIMIKNECNAET